MATRTGNVNAVSAGAVTSLSFSPSGAVSAGDLICLGVYYGDDVTTLSINDATNGAGKDSLGNTYITAAMAATNSNPVVLTTDGDFVYAFYCIVTNAGTPTIRLLASSGSHVIKVVGETLSPANVWSLDQSGTSNYYATGPGAGGHLDFGTQTPSTAAGYGFNAWAGAASIDTVTAGTVWTKQQETSDHFLVFQDVIYSSTTAIDANPTTTATGTEQGGIFLLFKDAAGGGGGLTVDEGEYAPPVPQPLETTILIF